MNMEKVIRDLINIGGVDAGVLGLTIAVKNILEGEGLTVDAIKAEAGWLHIVAKDGEQGYEVRLRQAGEEANLAPEIRAPKDYEE